MTSRTLTVVHTTGKYNITGTLTMCQALCWVLGEPKVAKEKVGPRQMDTLTG